MIFPVQKINITYSVEFSSDHHYKFKNWPKVDVMRRDFNEHLMTQVPMTEDQLGEMQMMGDVHVGINYTETLDFMYVALPSDDFLFSSEVGPVDNPSYHRRGKGVL